MGCYGQTCWYSWAGMTVASSVASMYSCVSVCATAQVMMARIAIVASSSIRLHVGITISVRLPQLIFARPTIAIATCSMVCPNTAAYSPDRLAARVHTPFATCICLAVAARLSSSALVSYDPRSSAYLPAHERFRIAAYSLAYSFARLPRPPLPSSPAAPASRTSLPVPLSLPTAPPAT
jgi:hypothetical protein